MHQLKICCPFCVYMLRNSCPCYIHIWKYSCPCFMHILNNSCQCYMHMLNNSCTCFMHMSNNTCPWYMHQLKNDVHVFLLWLFYCVFGEGGERMNHFIKYLLYVNIHLMGVFNTLYSVSYLFQYITRAVIVRCFNAALFLCFFYYYLLFFSFR